MPSDLVSHSRAALIAAGITGLHKSHTRANALSKITAVVDGDPQESFGLSGATNYSVDEVLGFVADLTGCSPDIAADDEYDLIDPDKTTAGIVAAATRLAEEAARGSTLLAVTGHPTGLLEHHIRVVDAFRRAGGKPLCLREDEDLGYRAKHSEVRYIGGVGCLADWGSLKHTHSPEPMVALLEGSPWPDIVLGDHGFAGAAMERGIPTIAVMDINDPALAVAWAERRDVIIVPMDDNRLPRLYEPSWTLFEAILAGEDV